MIGANAILSIVDSAPVFVDTPAPDPAAIAEAAQGIESDVARSFVRPWNTFGVRMRAKIAMCGPPRAALIVLDDDRPQGPRATGLRSSKVVPLRAIR